ncbi:MAG TPA: hypothetical protein VJX95_03070 [Oscillospiraceae bacterium]|nr:hypothetical protein [Oscillospiraceae bacterium]
MTAKANEKSKGNEQTKKEEFFSYKGLPLLRNGNTLYYGNMTDDYVVMLTIIETTKLDKLDVATKVRVQMISTDPAKNAADMIVKTSDRGGLYDALDIGSIWLERSSV